MAGIALAPSVEEIAGAPKFERSRFKLEPRGVDYLQRYLEHYAPLFDGPTACCVGSSVVVGMQARSLEQGTPVVPLSWGFAYYDQNGPSAPYSGDATFANGTNIVGVCSSATNYGVCAAQYYSQDWVLSHWNNGAPYAHEHLPTQACWDDAPQRRISPYQGWQIVFSGPPSLEAMARIAELLRAGYPVPLHYAHHAICLLSVSDDGYWFYGADSDVEGDNGMGVGMVAKTRDLLMAEGVCGAVIAEVWPGPELPDEILPPEPPIEEIPPAETAFDEVRDMAGHVWTFGPPTPVGHEIHRDGVLAAEGQGDTLAVTPTEVRVRNDGFWYLYQENPPAWIASGPP